MYDFHSRFLKAFFFFAKAIYLILTFISDGDIWGKLKLKGCCTDYFWLRGDLIQHVLECSITIFSGLFEGTPLAWRPLSECFPLLLPKNMHITQTEQVCHT